MDYTNKLLCFLFVAVFMASVTEARKRNATHIQFYMHDTPGGPNPSAVRVAGQPINATASGMGAMFGFGSIYVMDNALTMTPEVNSTLIGRAQGLYAVSSQEGEFSLLMTLTYNFVSGAYNGSSLSIVGRNPVMNEVREMPVVGGTGVFRLARGFALAKTHSMNQVDAIIGYNVTVIPYY
ncbi:Plant disease resistance response protein [Artemisia annua]|uniref:Dirigent protein n=2 Tax=Artemisia annua TaxID=35608 RepID=A0A2U1MZW7_ARTAN|nr:Plant disease resistance response protein [Artemisia annua]